MGTQFCALAPYRPRCASLRIKPFTVCLQDSAFLRQVESMSEGEDHAAQIRFLHRGNRTETFQYNGENAQRAPSSGAKVIKRLRPFADVAEERRALFVEAALQAHVQGSGVPEVLTLGLPAIDAAHAPLGELSAFEQSRVPGRTLFEVCASEESAPCLDLGTVAGWMAQLCDIVARLQRATDASGELLHFVHRDITPHNVMVEGAHQGPECKIWLVDFGISHCLSWGPLSTERALQGTPSYLPPEISKGESPSAASDIYQVALCARHVVRSLGLAKINGALSSWSSDALRSALAPQHMERPTARELCQAFTEDAKLIG